MADLKKHKNLIAFNQLGCNISKSEIKGGQVVCNCLFCGSKKFFINPENKMWDCKTCGETGGYKTLMKKVVKHFKNNNNKTKVNLLAKSKDLSPEIFKHHEVLYNSVNNTYLLPVYEIDGKELWDIRIYSNKKFMSLSGCKVGLFGWNEIKRSKNIYILEGEWDKMAFDIMIQDNDLDAVAVSVPGAQTFKDQWGDYVKNKNVFVVYDKDEPGKIGATKLNSKLKDIVKKISFVHWKEEEKDGYDFRDFFIKTKKIKTSRFRKLGKLFKRTPPEPKKKALDEETEVIVESYEGDYIAPKKVYEVYKKWLYLHDTDVIDVIFGTIIANRLEGDPLWLFLVAPPGGTKTELVNTVSESSDVVTTSTLTPQSLISGANMPGGGDPSLIPILNNKVMVVKDFTPILTMNETQKDEIFGILRDAYDGKTEKNFGNGVRRSYKSKFGLISAVTPAIDAYTENNASLGERFLRYDIKHSKSAKDQMKMLEQVFANAGKEVEMRTELSELGTAVLSYDFKKLPEIPEEIRFKIMALAQFVAKMRGTVIRDRFSGDVTHNAFSEFGTRMVKQFTKLLNGIGMFKNLDVITKCEYMVACDMGKSTIPKKNENLVEHMYFEGKDEEYSSKELSEDLKLPTSTINRTLDDLKQLDMMNKEMNGPGKTLWSLSEDCIFLIEKSEIFKGGNE